MHNIFCEKEILNEKFPTFVLTANNLNLKKRFMSNLKCIFFIILSFQITTVNY